MSFAAFLTVPAIEATLSVGILVTGPLTLIAAVTAPVASKIGAATHRAPSTASSSSTAYPCSCTFANSRFNFAGTTSVRGVNLSYLQEANNSSISLGGRKPAIAFPSDVQYTGRVAPTWVTRRNELV